MTSIRATSRFVTTARNCDLCAYDWELATLGAPQRDLAVFLCFVLPPDVSVEEADRWVELHRRTLAEATGHSISAYEWRRGLRSALADFLINRLAFYAMINRVCRQQFLPRVVRAWQRLNEIFADETFQDNRIGKASALIPISSLQAIPPGK